MKKNVLNVNGARLLNKNEQRKINGGSFASCQAECYYPNGELRLYVSCEGDNCTATDGTGCKSDYEENKCPM